MEDLIRRADVLALAKDVTLKNGAKHRCIDATLIHEIPPVEPVRHGRWEVIFWDNIPKIAQCSECGEGLIFTKKDYPLRHISNYCPNCGAKMEVDDERSD